MAEELSDEEIQEQARKFIEEKPYRVEQWENGRPNEKMLARGVKMMAGVSTDE